MCIAKNGKDTKNTRQIVRRMYFVRNGENCQMQKIDWCEEGLELTDISTKNTGKYYLTLIMKYIMVILEN